MTSPQTAVTSPQDGHILKDDVTANSKSFLKTSPCLPSGVGLQEVFHRTRRDDEEPVIFLTLTQ